MRLINRLIKWNEQSKTSLRYQSEQSASGGGSFRLQSKIGLKTLIFNRKIQIQIGQRNGTSLLTVPAADSPADAIFLNSSSQVIGTIPLEQKQKII